MTTKLDQFVSALGLEFEDAKGNTFEEGWYLWRNSPDWPKLDYKIVEVSGDEMRDEEPMDSYGARWESVWCKCYGQLAGPIIGR